MLLSFPVANRLPSETHRFTSTFVEFPRFFPLSGWGPLSRPSWKNWPWSSSVRRTPMRCPSPSKRRPGPARWLALMWSPLHPQERRGDGVEFTTWGLKNGGWTVIEWCYNSDLMGIDCWSKGDVVRYITDNTLCNVPENNGDTPKLAIRIMKMTNDDNKLKLRVFHFRTDPSEYISVTKRGLLQPTRGKW